MRVRLVHLAVATLLACALTACATGGVARLAAVSQSHLDQQSSHLDAATRHLLEAHRRLATQNDPHNAVEEVDAGNEQVRQASAANQQIRQDEIALRNAATSLQKHIDEHRNDLLGPRAIRIRNWLILIAVVLSLGAALLQFGPLLGGPLGGAVIIAGHVLTVFAWPILRGAWALTVRLARWAWSGLEKIADRAAQPGAAPTSAAGGTASATVGSA
ncbi:MAG: hypothetical protein ABR964_00535 [Tepidisphaeraceae bacterium]